MTGKKRTKGAARLASSPLPNAEAPTVSIPIPEDPRLEGWTQVTALYGYTGDTAEIVAIKPIESGGLFDASSLRIVVVRIRDAQGRLTGYEHHLQFKPTDDRRLDSLAAFRAAVEKTLGDTECVQNWKIGRQQISDSDIDCAACVMSLFYQWLEKVKCDDSALAREIERQAERLYYVGRTVAIWELKKDWEGTAKSGRAVASRNTAGGISRGQQKQAEAQAWQEPAAQWARYLLQRMPTKSGRKPHTLSSIAKLIVDNWEDRPFHSGPELIEKRYVERILPRWAALGWIDLPPPRRRMTLKRG